MKEKSKKITAKDGLDIYYWTTPGTKETVVMHPGSAVNHSALYDLEKRINELGHPTVIFDPRGSGYSSAPTEPKYYDLDDFTSDLQDIIEKEGIENPVLLGHSLGSTIILDYTAKTNNAKNLISICGSHKFSETTKNKLFFHLMDKVLRYTEYLGSAAMLYTHKIRNEKRTVPDQSNWKDLSDFQMWLSIVDVPFSEVTAHIASGKKIVHWDLTEQLKQINKDLLLVFGNKDFMVDPRAGGYIKDFVKGKCYLEVIEEATHTLPMTHSEEVVKFIQKYEFL